jgi:hypothetical protein
MKQGHRDEKAVFILNQEFSCTRQARLPDNQSYVVRLGK